MGADFFISYAGENRVWAEWIAAQLTGAGYSVRFQAADFRPGQDFVHEMHAAVMAADRTIAVLSPAYLRSQFGEAEWRAVFARDPSGELGLLIPVRVQPCDPPGLLASRIYVDLVEVAEAAARRKLLAAVGEAQPKPSTAAFPGPAGVRFPGAGPVVANLAPRNPVFTGRDDLIGQVYEGLRGDGPAAVVSEAVHGLGGVGKSTLAVEYAYRFGSDYDVVWWIDAEQPATVAGQLAALGRRLGLAEPADEQDGVAAVFAELQGRDRWLLIYDNVERPGSVAGLLPGAGAGHVLVTSRWPDWRGVAHTLQVRVWPRTESVAFLRTRTRHVDEDLLAELAELVGDLPLAVEEAAAYLEQTGEDLAAYVGLVRDRARDLFAAAPGSESVDERRVATVWTLSLDRVHAQEPVAEQLLSLLAFLAPQVPRDLIGAGAEVLPEPLRAAVSDRLVFNRLLEAAGRYALIGLDSGEVGMHRLVQAVVQSRLTASEAADWAAAAVALVRELFPNESWELASWPDCARLLPQALTVAEHAERLRAGEEQSGWLLDRVSTYLQGIGQFRQAEPFARRALALTRTVLGPDHVETAWRRDQLGSVLQDLGRFDEARAELEQALAVGLAVLGPDHRDIGVWRSDLGGVLQDLGRLDEAHTELEQALAIGLAALGPDHPFIVIWRNNLGRVLQDLGRFDEARTEYEQALAIGLAVLAVDHNDIGMLRSNLGSVLQDLGRFDEARAEYEQALAIGLAALGPDHPTIGLRRRILGSVLQDLGRFDEARAEYEQALAISLAALGPDHGQTRTARRHLDRLTSVRGRAGTDDTSGKNNR